MLVGGFVRDALPEQGGRRGGKLDTERPGYHLVQRMFIFFLLPQSARVYRPG